MELVTSQRIGLEIDKGSRFPNRFGWLTKDKVMGKATTKNLFYNAKFDGDIFKYQMTSLAGKLARLFGYTTRLEIPLNITVEYTYKHYFLFSSFTISLWKHRLSHVKELKLRKVKILFFGWDKFNAILITGIQDILWLSLKKENIGLMTIKDQASDIALSQLKFHLSKALPDKEPEAEKSDFSGGNYRHIRHHTSQANGADVSAHLSTGEYCYPAYVGEGNNYMIVHTKPGKSFGTRDRKGNAQKIRLLKRSITQGNRETSGIGSEINSYGVPSGV